MGSYSAFHPTKTRWGKNASEAARLFFLHLAARLGSDKWFAKSWKCTMDKTYPDLFGFGDITSELNGLFKKMIQSAIRESCEN